MTVSCIVIRGVCFDIMSFPPVGNPCIVKTLCLFTHTTTGPVWTPVVWSPCKLRSNCSHILWSGGIDSVPYQTTNPVTLVHSPSSSGEISSLKRDNPLYESQEIRMEMFADVSDEEEGKY